jgi:hypothetical protein
MASKYVCEECGREFALPQGLGRHLSTQHRDKKLRKKPWKQKPVTATVKAGKPRIHKGVMANLNGYQDQIAQFETACSGMIALVRTALTEVAIYKKERDELAEFKQRITSITGQSPTFTGLPSAGES